MQTLTINPKRLKADFDQLAKIGRSPSGGLNRPALSEAHLEARAWFSEQVHKAGLIFSVDGAGNHSAFLDCAPNAAPRLLLGSHLDSVIDGGIYDGALGVLAALEVLRVIQEAGLALPVGLEAIDFTDEEGTLVGLLGSSSLTGRLKPDDLQKPRGGREELLSGLVRAGLTEAGVLSARRMPKNIAGYLELHIEQSAHLTRSKVNIGVVTGIVGISSYKLCFVGQACHAGTTPMEGRQDAMQGAAYFTLKAHKIVLQDFPGCSVNVGSLGSRPRAFNIVPAMAELSLELRAPDSTIFDELENALLKLAGEAAHQYNLQVQIYPHDHHSPTLLTPIAQKSINNAASSLGLSTMPLFSGAAHDAQMFASICPTGMIFIPSTGGSHSPTEHAVWTDCVNGANTLLRAALTLVEETNPAKDI